MKDRLLKDLNHIEVMLKYSNKIMDVKSKFYRDEYKLDEENLAVLFSFYLMQIGEQIATGNLSEELKDKYGFIEWKSIRGLRNIVSHTYHQILINEVFEIVKNDLPVLIADLNIIREDLLKEYETRQVLENESNIN